MIKMVRAPFQILVFPFYRNEHDEIMYAIFKRSDAHYYQAIAGGGEDDETSTQAAKRETFEESGIPQESKYIILDSKNTVPVEGVAGYFRWGEDTYVIPEHCFGVEVKNQQLTLSEEHTKYKWVNYEDAINMLNWHSNKNALWELNQRLLRFQKPQFI